MKLYQIHLAMWWSCIKHTLPCDEVVSSTPCHVMKLYQAHLAMWWSCIKHTLPCDEVVSSTPCHVMKLYQIHLAMWWSCIKYTLPCNGNQNYNFNDNKHRLHTITAMMTLYQLSAADILIITGVFGNKQAMNIIFIQFYFK
jgi:hypothetical protein